MFALWTAQVVFLTLSFVCLLATNIPKIVHQEKSYRDPYFILYFIALSVYVLLLTYWMFLSKNPRKRKFAWGTCGGCLTGLQNFLKDALTIMKATPADVPHYSWLFYFFFIMAGVSAFGGLLILTACMKRYDASYSAAGFVGSFVVSASIMSAVHYNTFGELKGIVNYIMYPIGLLVLTLGVFVLVGESKDVNHHNGEEGDDVEDIMNDALFSGRTGRRARKNSDMDTTVSSFNKNVLLKPRLCVKACSLCVVLWVT